MNNLLTTETLKRQNQAFAGTGGVSEENRSGGLRPAFHDLASGRTALARFADGTPAPMHLLDGLPKEWVVQRDAAGRVRAIKATVIAGFVRAGLFYTREEAAAALHWSDGAGRSALGTVVLGAEPVLFQQRLQV